MTDPDTRGWRTSLRRHDALVCYALTWAMVKVAHRAQQPVPTEQSEPAPAVKSGGMLIYGAGGVIAPFIGIKLIDVIVSALGVK